MSGVPFDQVTDEKPAFFGAPESTEGFVPAEPSAAPAPKPRADYPGYNPQGAGWRNGYNPPEPVPYLDTLAEARSAGHSWEEIHNFQGQQHGAAYAAGYTQEEIDAHLGYQDQQPFERRAETSWNFAVPEDERFLSGLTAPEPRVDLSLSPSFRDDYAQALLDQEVRDPRDFAYAYAGAALRAADADFADVRLRAAAGFGAEEAARGLPTPEELTDAAVAVAPEGALDFTRRKLMENWQRTGEPVLEQAKRILASPNPAAELGYLAADEVLRQVQKPFDILAGFGDGFWSAGADRDRLREELKDADLAVQLSTAIGRVISPRMFWEMFAHNGEMVTRAAKGESITVDEAIFAAAAMAHISRFPGGAGPIQPDILPPLPRAELPPGPRRPGPPTIDGEGNVIAGELPGVQVKLPPLPDVPLIDFDAPVGAPPRLITAREALIEPAKAPEIIDAVAHELSLASKADRMEMLRQENETAATTDSTGTFFQRKLAEMRERGEDVQFRGEEPTTERLMELAEGHENARTVGSFFNDTFFGVLKDETGAIPIDRLFGDPSKRAASRLAREQYLTARSGVMREQSRGEREILHVDAALAPLAKYVNVIMPEFKAELAKGPMGDPMMTQAGALLNFIEGVGYGPALKLDHPTVGVAETIREKNVWKYQLLQQAHAEGIIDAPGYRDNYFRHMWTDRGAATTMFNNYMQGSPGFGKQGSTATLKQRTLPTFADGIRAGLTPVEPDLLKLTIYDIGATIRMYRAGRIRKEMEQLGLLNWRSERVGDEIALTGVGVSRSVPIQKPVALRRAEAAARDAYDAAAAPFDARIAQLEADVQAFVNRGASAGAIAYARQLVVQEKGARRVALQPLQADVATATEAAAPGAYMEIAYAPPAVARLYNTWLSHGWGSNPKTESLKNQIMYMKNRFVGLQLMAPMFHTGVILATTASTALQETMARVAGAVRNVAAGDLPKAAENLGRAALAATVIPNAIAVYRKGLKARDDYVKLINDPILNQLVDAGLRIGKRQIPYAMGVEQNYVAAWAQNNAGRTVQERLGNVIKAAGRDVVDKLKKIGGPDGEPMLWNTENSRFGRPGSVPMAPLRALKVPLDLMAQALTTISAPLFDHLVPVMKAGAAMQMFGTWLETHQTASPEVVQRRAQQAVMDAEFRYGEQNLDNIFVNKWAKDTAQMSMISATWALSAWAWFAGATGIRGEWNPFNTQTFVGALVVYHALNGLLTFGHTGQLPQSYTDLVNFRTGGVLASGKPERGMLPTEFKEIYDMGKIAATALARKDPMYPFEGIVDYALGKGNLLLGGALTMARGEDAIGIKPAYSPGGWGGWFTKQVAPIVLEGLTSPKKGTGLNAFERTFIRQAPEWIMDPDTFYAKQRGLASTDPADKSRWSKEGIRRAVKDNNKLETPKQLDLPAASPSRGRSSSGPRTPSSRKSSGTKSPSWGR